LIILTNNPTYAQLLKSPVLLLAFGFGSGLSPKAPGTVGSFLALVLWLFLAKLSLPFYLVFVAICAVAGVYICGVAADRLGVHDHGGIVCDEFVGVWVAMAALLVSWASIILGFGLFRLFDIFKPWPISWMDKNISGGLGIMLDDIAAGVATAVSIGLLSLLGWI